MHDATGYVVNPPREAINVMVRQLLQFPLEPNFQVINETSNACKVLRLAIAIERHRALASIKGGGIQ